MAAFTTTEWNRAFARLTGRESTYGFPQRRPGSVILGSFNIRDFGNPDKRSDGAWRLLEHICRCFDFVAIQEVEDDLASLRRLQDALGSPYEVAFSDVTGALPSEIGPISPHERLAFLYHQVSGRVLGMQVVAINGGDGVLGFVHGFPAVKFVSVG